MAVRRSSILAVAVLAPFMIATGAATQSASPVASLGPVPSPASSLTANSVHLASMLAAADFDRDGYADLVVGAPGASVDRANGQALKGAGSVTVFYGSAVGLSDERRETWTQESPDVAGRAQAGARFGASLATGDFDGDGYSDLAIGAPGIDVDGTRDVGAVLMLYGSPEGLRADPRQPALIQEPNNRRAGGAAGSALATLDIPEHVTVGFGGQDPVPARVELAVGVPGGSAATYVNQPSYNRGAVWVVGGSFLDPDATWDDGSTFDCDVGDNGRLGASFAVGHFDADPEPELVIGAPGADDRVPPDGEWRHRAGRVCIGGVGRGFGPSVLRPGIELPIVEPWNRLGTALAAGDLNGDGHDDLAVGVPGLGDGAVLVVPSDAGGGLRRHEATWVLAGQSPTGSGKGDHAGTALLVLRPEPAGPAQLIVGAPGKVVGASERAGTVLVGTLDATQTWQWVDLGPQLRDGAEPTRHLGTALTAGDYDGDGAIDLVIGAPGGGRVSGAVHLVYGFGTDAERSITLSDPTVGSTFGASLR